MQLVVLQLGQSCCAVIAMGSLEFVGGILSTKQSVDAARRGGVGNAAKDKTKLISETH